MCLVVFQKIFRKIFSGVWKMLQGKDKTRKTNTAPRLTLDARLGSTAQCFAGSSPMTAPSIAIDGAISHRAASRDLDRRHDLAPRRSRLARRRDRDRRHNLAKHHEGEVAISDRDRRCWCDRRRRLELGRASGADWVSVSLSHSLSLSLSLSLSGIHLK